MVSEIIRDTATWVWGEPMLLFLTGVGLYLTWRLRGLQFSQLFESARLTIHYRAGSGEGNISPLQSLFSALGGLIGNGNLAGVATAIAIGGPGAVFWLWVASLIAMVIVYAETFLAVSSRRRSDDGTYSGGPMYYIESVLGMRWLAVLFALAMGAKTLMATATIQSNSIGIAFQALFDKPAIWACIAVAALTWFATIGGLRSVVGALERITPAMVLLYLFMSSAILLLAADQIPGVLALIFENAFTPSGATGGFAGAGVLMAMRYGVARGFYSNEAGTGSAPIMYSTARSDDPRKLALIGMFGVVIDTAVGTLTALVILATGSWVSGATSTALTIAAFESHLGAAGAVMIFLCSLLFGYSTLVAWCFYGEQCFAFIWGAGIRRIYRWAFSFAVLFGFFEPELLWSWGDLLNAGTVLVNVSAVILLARLVRRR
jgi:AGCS family alanine or glycine:cation symporter